MVAMSEQKEMQELDLTTQDGSDTLEIELGAITSPGIVA